MSDTLLTRSRAILAVGVVLATFIVTDAGGWIGPDRWSLAQPWSLLEGLLHAQPTPPGEPGDATYRPLALFTHLLPGGPLTDRWTSLLLHLANIALLARLATRIGAPGPAAWFGVALVGVHPAVVDAVAWPGASHMVLATTLVLAGWNLLVDGRDRPAGLVLAVCPFVSETFLLVPITALGWMWADRRLARPTLLLCWAGSGLYLAARYAAGLPPPAWGSLPSVLENLGGLAQRLGVLLIDPRAGDALALLHPSLGRGLVLFTLGLVLFAALKGRRWLVPAVVPLLLLLPWAPPVGRLGYIPDHAFYPLFLGLGPLVALAAGRVPDHIGRWAWALVLALVFLTAQRLPLYADEGLLYGASYARDITNPHAAWRLARAVVRTRGDCTMALPLFEQAADVERVAAEGARLCRGVLNP